MNWIARKSGKHCARYMEPLDSCFDLNQFSSAVYTVISPLEIELVTTEYWAETLPLSCWSISSRNNTKLTSHGKSPVREIMVYTAD